VAAQDPVAGIEYQVGFSTCLKYNASGSVSEIEYDSCTSFCCGKVNWISTNLCTIASFVKLGFVNRVCQIGLF